MVDNQHRKIEGYRELTEEEIALMNEVKELNKQCLDMIEKLQTYPTLLHRDLTISKVNIQQGFMWMIRAIAKPGV